MRSRHFMLWPVLLAVALLGGCSAIGLVYNRLPMVASYQLGRYVELRKEQKAIFDRQLDDAWRWHRSTQLPLYAAELRQVAELTQGPMSREQVAGVTAHIRGYVETTTRQAVSASAPVLSSFDDAQVASVLERMDKDADKQRTQDRKLSDEKWRRERYKSAIDNLREWTGDDTAEQRDRLKQWSAGLERDPADAPDESRDEFAALLKTRAEPGFSQRLLDSIEFDPRRDSQDAGDARRATRIATNQQLLSDLSRSLVPEQRTHLRKKLLGLAEELEQLSREPR